MESRSPPEASAAATAAAPFSRLPHKYDTQPTSLYATHTYVDPNLDLSAVDTTASNSVNDDLIAQLKTLLRLRLEEEKEGQEGGTVRKKEISEVRRKKNVIHFISYRTFRHAMIDNDEGRGFPFMTSSYHVFHNQGSISFDEAE